MSEKIRINSIADLAQVNARIRAKGFPCNVTITGAARTIPQNSLFHMWCAEIAAFFVRMGKTTFSSGAAMNDANVKRNLKQTFLGDTAIQDVNLKTGEITERYELRHTSELDAGEMQAFMTCIDKWANEHGIYLTHPEDSEYMKYQREQGEAA